MKRKRVILNEGSNFGKREDALGQESSIFTQMKKRTS